MKKSWAKGTPIRKQARTALNVVQKLFLKNKINERIGAVL